MQSLIDASADVNHRNRTMGRTALHNAARRALPHLHDDWLTAATSAPVLICTGIVVTRATSAPRLPHAPPAPQSPPALRCAPPWPHLRRDTCLVWTLREGGLVQPGPSSRAWHTHTPPPAAAMLVLSTCVRACVRGCAHACVPCAGQWRRIWALARFLAACSHGDIESVSMLLRHGADATIGDNDK